MDEIYNDAFSEFETSRHYGDLDAYQVQKRKKTVAEIIKIKGKDYAPVALRVQKFREDKGEAWAIETALLHFDEQIAVMRAEIRNHEGRVVSTGTGSALRGKSTVYTGREIEKAETSAVGRALAMLGYGTDDLLEDDADGHLADSPTERKQAPAPAQNDLGDDYRELSFVFVEAKQAKNGDGYLVYEAEADSAIKVNVFKHNRDKFVGLPADAKFPAQFVGTVKRDGKFWNLAHVASFS